MKHGLLILAICLLGISGYCQTVCVRPELTVIPDSQRQLAISHMLQARGITVDCKRYDFEVDFYLVTGTAYTGTTDYLARYNTAPGIVDVAVSHYEDRYNYGLWVLALHRRGEVGTITRKRAGSLKSAVNGVVKTLRKCS